METVYEPSGEDVEELRDPRGEVVQGEEVIEEVKRREYHRLISVGDRVSIDLARGGTNPDIAVVDGRIQRESIDEAELEVLEADIICEAENPAGGVTSEGWRAVREAAARQCKSMVRIQGEEDLLALPATVFASPGSLLVYGQRELGAVLARTGAELKDFVEDLVGRRRYGKVIVGGSWDRFHCGHRSLLMEAFARGEEVDIGVTSDTYVEEKDGEDFQSFGERKAVLEEFLQRFGVEDRSRIIEIEDHRGNAVEEGDALLATPETIGSAEKVNEERKETGREPLELIEVPLVEDEEGRPVSSTRIREGEIDRDGRKI